jgi:hypothetical protein
VAAFRYDAVAPPSARVHDAARRPTAGARRRATAALLLAVLLLALPRAAYGPPSDSAGSADREPSPPPARIASSNEPAPTQLDLTGKWLLRHVVRRSERANYRGLVLLFRVELVQQGARVTGTAVKWRENGREVAVAARSRLEIEGTLQGDEIAGRFVEVRQGRRTRGTFRWRYSIEEGRLYGTFTTNVASARGDATATSIG